MTFYMTVFCYSCSTIQFKCLLEYSVFPSIEMATGGQFFPLHIQRLYTKWDNYLYPTHLLKVYIKDVIRNKINLVHQISNPPHFLTYILYGCTAAIISTYITHRNDLEIIIFILLYLTSIVDIKYTCNRTENSTLTEYQLQL
jgi:hypothetical protein